MTKQDPNKLCESCKEFDFAMNRSGGVSFDMLVQCDCDENVKKTDKKPYVYKLDDECESCQ